MKCVVIGPRGGLHNADVSCDTCVCANKCAFSGPSTRPWGCFDWVDIEGRRVATSKLEAIEAAMPPDDLDGDNARLLREEHVREEIEAERVAPPDPEPCPPCECGDPDCSQLNGHPIPEEEPHD